MNFSTFEDLREVLTPYAGKINALGSAYVPRGSSTFENLPTVLTENMLGYAYNVTNDFTTTALFVEGAGKPQKAGTNVMVVDRSTYDAVTPVGTENPKTEGWYEEDINGKYVLTGDETVDGTKTYYEKTVVVKYDTVGSFVDLTELENNIKAIQDMITGEFDKSADLETGAVVIYDGKLYQLTSAYSAYSEVTPVGTENPQDEGWYEYDGTDYTLSTDTTVDSAKTYYQLNDWDASKAQETTIAELIKNAEPQSLTAEQINSLIALLD